ncbi:MAG: N-acetylmuramoyl-L-alanine amidase [Planctomycetes bacterium]|nr:N-acetylmuramoyl-L-alanine amidase [Planctomycetota bacterium]
MAERAQALLIGVLFWTGVACPAAAAGKPAVDFQPAYSGNYSPRSGRTIRRVVMHTIEGPLSSGVNTFDSRLPPGEARSAHYLVGFDGTIIQMVRDKDVAWHAVGHNAETIGIEHEGYSRRDGWTEAQLRASAGLVHWLSLEYGFPVDRNHVVSHEELDPRNRDDPGPHFPWDYYLKLARADPAGLTSRGDAVADLAKALGLDPHRPSRPTFKDVPADDPRYPWIEAAALAGLVRGHGDGRFLPDRAMDRGTFAALLQQALGLAPPSGGGGGFPDVPAGHPRAAAIAAADAAGLMVGRADGGFGPDDFLGRADLKAVADRVRARRAGVVEALDWLRRRT